MKTKKQLIVSSSVKRLALKLVSWNKWHGTARPRYCYGCQIKIQDSTSSLLQMVIYSSGCLTEILISFMIALSVTLKELISRAPSDCWLQLDGVYKKIINMLWYSTLRWNFTSINCFSMVLYKCWAFKWTDLYFFVLVYCLPGYEQEFSIDQPGDPKEDWEVMWSDVTKIELFGSDKEGGRRMLNCMQKTPYPLWSMRVGTSCFRGAFLQRQQDDWSVLSEG